MSSLAKCLAGVAFAAIGATSASADITITAGPGNFPGDQEVLYNSDLLINDATTIQGITNPAGDQPRFLVDFTSTDVLHSNGGQASIQAADGAFRDMLITLDTAGATFQTLIFNVDVCQPEPGKPITGELTITGTNSLGATTSDTFDVGSNGQNFFMIEATNGQKISSVGFTSDVDLCKLEQVRIGGIEGAVPVPLPAAALPAGALLGLGGLVRTIRGRKA